MCGGRSRSEGEIEQLHQRLCAKPFHNRRPLPCRIALLVQPLCAGPLAALWLPCLFCGLELILCWPCQASVCFAKRLSSLLHARSRQILLDCALALPDAKSAAARMRSPGGLRDCRFVGTPYMQVLTLALAISLTTDYLIPTRRYSRFFVLVGLQLNTCSAPTLSRAVFRCHQVRQQSANVLHLQHSISSFPPCFMTPLRPLH